MSVNYKSDPASDHVATSLFPSFTSRNEVKEYFARYPAIWKKFLKFPTELQEELLGFCIGEHGSS